MAIYFSQLIPEAIIPLSLREWISEQKVEVEQLEACSVEEGLLLFPLLLAQNPTAVVSFVQQKLERTAILSPLWIPLAIEISSTRLLDELLYPKLEKKIAEWYTPVHDRDQNQIPEASGWNGEIDRSYLEEPDLIAALYFAHQMLEATSLRLELPVNPFHVKQTSLLSKRLKELWSPAARGFMAQLRGTKENPTAGRLFSLEDETGLSAVSLPIGMILEKPNRVSISWKGVKEQRLPIEITVHGGNAEGWGEQEVALAEQISWQNEDGWWVGEKEWGWIERISVRGMRKQIVQLVAQAPNIVKPELGYLLWPLWCGAVDSVQANFLWRRSLHDPLRYWSKYGVRRALVGEGVQEIDLVENILLAAGLWRAGLEKEGVQLSQLLTKLPTENGRFFRRYHIESGEGRGGLLLDTRSGS